VYVGGDPVNLVDPDGRASCDIILCGQNGSSVTIETDLINAEVNVSALPGTDFGGNHVLSGEGVMLAGLDLVGTLDPTPISDGLSASIYAQKGQYVDALVSSAGIIPVIGDVGKVARVERHFSNVRSAIRALNRSKGSVRTLDDIPKHALTRDVEDIYRRLDEYHGISR
jgi:hypothetical protein